jgi:tetratricopeptide (TPR) repeat protein
MQEPDLSLIRHLKSRGKFEEAHEQLEQWMEAQPNSPYLELEMAGILDELGRPHEAVLYYEDALAHEAPAPFGFGAEIAALIAEKALYYLDAPIIRVTSQFTPVPVGRSEDYILPGAKDIVDAVHRSLKGG